MISNRKIELKHDLPNCPAGRFFKEDINGDWFHSMTDDEYMLGKYKFYKFTKDEILNNSYWFTHPDWIDESPKYRLLVELPIINGEQFKVGTIKSEKEWCKMLGRYGGIYVEDGDDGKWFERVYSK